jgi:hypothetical protein
MVLAWAMLCFPQSLRQRAFTSAKAHFREIDRYVSDNITTMSEKRQKGKAGLHRKKSIAGHSDTLPFAARAAA